MASASFLFHANLLYAEYPFERIPEIVERSYIPVLQAILARQKIKSVLNFSGFTLELLAGEHPEIYPGKPEVLSLIKEGVVNGKIELSGTSWAHVILPCLPLALQTLDIRLFRSTAERLLGIAPRGFFPPELGISPLLPELLVNEGYAWCVVDREVLAYSEQGFLNDYNEFDQRPPSFTKLTAQAQQGGPLAKLKTLFAMRRVLKHISDFTPVEWCGASDAIITAFPLESAWIAISLLSLSRSFFFRERSLALRIRKGLEKMKGFFFPYSSDIEFFGVGGNTLSMPIPVARIDGFFALLDSLGVNLSLPGEYLQTQHSPPHRCYCKAGTWSTEKNFALWLSDPDNEVLDRLALDAWNVFREKEGSLTAAVRDELLKDLLLSFNSDGRGWTPLSEHRLFCYNKAKKVLKALM